MFGISDFTLLYTKINELPDHGVPVVEGGAGAPAAEGGPVVLHHDRHGEGDAHEDHHADDPEDEAVEKV